MLLDEAISYANDLTSSPLFLELKNLKDEIDRLYSKEIVNFKNNEANYLEALKYKDYCSNFDSIKKQFIESKARLYEKEEVKRYFVLEKQIQKLLNDDIKLIKDSVSKVIFINNINRCKK